jgi:uncharacterized membrane protein YqaE (UPF0057 family)
MNKQIIQLFLFVSVIITLSSCSKQSSGLLTKRHYRSGYYVDFGTKKQTISSAFSSSPKRSQIQVPSIGVTKSGGFDVPTKPSVASEKSAVSKNIIVAWGKTTNKNEAADNNLPEQNASNFSFANTLSEGPTATKDEVRVYVVNVPFVVIVICAIFIPPLGVGLMYGLNIYFWVDLLLTLLFFIPGMIFALIVVLM